VALATGIGQIVFTSVIGFVLVLALGRDWLTALYVVVALVAVVAREEFDGAALKRLGAPTILYPMRNAVDYAVEALSSIIRPRESRP